MRIKKTVLTLTVLHPEDFPLGNLSLEEIGREMDYGEIIGAFVTTSEEDVSPEKLEGELEAVGNDGDFFNSYRIDEDEDDEG